MTEREIKALDFEGLIAAYNATGRIAFYHPRKLQVSMNGGRRLSIRDAVIKMRECLTYENREAEEIGISDTFTH